MDTSVTYVLIARLPKAGVASFLEYEERVLPLLAEHGARLARRLRSADGLTEVHVVDFPSPQAFADYRDDPRRSQHAPLLATSGATVTLLEMHDAAEAPLDAVES